MAGTNGKDKFLEVNRNEEVTNLKIIGNIYQQLTATVVPNTALQLTAQQFVVPNLQVSGNILGPTTTTLINQLQTQGLFQQGETVTMLLSNTDPLASHVVTLGADWTPSQITIPPSTTLSMTYQISVGPPAHFNVIELYTVGSTIPANNTTVAPSNFGADFSLQPSQPYDMIVRNAANTMWVASDSVNGGHLPWLKLEGTVPSPTGDLLHVQDTNGVAYSNLVNIRNVNPINAVAGNNFQVLNLAVGNNSNFGLRGAGTADAIVRTNLDTPPGPTTNGYHFFSNLSAGGNPVFWVDGFGHTRVINPATAQVGATLGLDASSQITQGVSSRKFKEAIVDTQDTSFIHKFPVREFNYIGDNVKQIGAIVEELEPLIPEALRPAILNYKVKSFRDPVTKSEFERDMTTPENINLHGMVFCLLKEIQELKKEVEILKAH